MQQLDYCNLRNEYKAQIRELFDDLRHAAGSDETEMYITSLAILISPLLEAKYGGTVTITELTRGL